MDANNIGAMSCNPAIGGLAKGHLVREIDALGGVMGRAADQTGLQFRMLNSSKGPAVRGPRAQIDRHAYAGWMQQELQQNTSIHVVSGEIVALQTEPCGLGQPRVSGVVFRSGARWSCNAVVLTTGTFLDGIIHRGTERISAGRHGEPAATGLGDWLKAQGLETGRLKTGTPARLDAKSILWDRCTLQPGDSFPQPFSFTTHSITQQQVPCHITYTNDATHNLVHQHLHESAVYNGAIEGVGPRYCPSLEDKCARFPDRTRHQIFLEPEERAASVIYPNGISTSLPSEVQDRFLRTIPGLEQVRVLRYGYAIEYTFVPPHQVKPSLQCRAVDGLFLAGQINGTTGYEEAAAQGLAAGLNAVRQLRGLEPVLFSRENSYLGVLLDDLVTKEHREPYRMFTSRAEHRLLLRQDNADLRLTELAYHCGLIDSQRYETFITYRRSFDAVKAALERHRFKPTNVPPELAEECNLHRLESGISALEWLERPDADRSKLTELGVALPWPKTPTHPTRIETDWLRALEQVDIEAKYGGYLERERKLIARRSRQEHQPLPAEIDYSRIPGLRAEAAQKLTKFQPVTAGMASRIAGVNPTDVALVLAYVHGRKAKAA
jgi:tRNA uridine 5-carboxymethylaminomethyl modification enzyme